MTVSKSAAGETFLGRSPINGRSGAARLVLLQAVGSYEAPRIALISLITKSRCLQNSAVTPDG